MRTNTTDDIWDATRLLMSRVSKEKSKINKELSIDEKELREWFRWIVKNSKILCNYAVNSWPVHWFLCGIQIMIVLFAAISLSASAAVNLTAYGLQGLVYNASILGIWLMSTISCAQTMFENVYFGMKGIGYLRFQRLRMIEVKLFRSPFIPDPMCANRDPHCDKTKPVIEYLNYYAYEKSAQKAISDAVVNNRWIDDHRLTSEQMPIELRAHMILMMVARTSGDINVNHKILSRSFIDQYADLIGKVDKNQNFEKDVAVEDPFVNDLYRSAISPQGSITVTENKEDIGSQQYYIKLITMTKLARIAYFARAHIEAVTDTLEREKNPAWVKLNKKDKDQKILQAFRWTLVQYMRRQSQKVSDAVTANHPLMKYFVPIFSTSFALIPGGLSMLSSSPVLTFVKYTGKSWETMVCVWFWFCGVTNFMTSTKKDIRKVCAKICRYINRHLVYQTTPIKRINNESWWPSVTTVLQVLCAASMTVAATIFMILNITKVLSAPGDVGAHYVLNLLFNHVAPWLEPIFIPLCYLLSALSAFLTYNYTTKYYSSERIPKPKVGLDKQTAFIARWSYLLRHNFDLTRHPVGKILKIIASIVALSQSIVFIVSAASVMGPWLLLAMMPSVFAICLARNRKDIESAFDLYNQWQHPLTIDLVERYQAWFSKPDTAPTTAVVPEPLRTMIETPTDAAAPRISQEALRRSETVQTTAPTDTISTGEVITDLNGSDDGAENNQTALKEPVTIYGGMPNHDNGEDDERELVIANNNTNRSNPSPIIPVPIVDSDNTSHNNTFPTIPSPTDDNYEDPQSDVESLDNDTAASDDEVELVDKAAAPRKQKRQHPGDGSYYTLDNVMRTPDRNEGNQGNLGSSFTPHSGFTDSPLTDKSRGTPRKPQQKIMSHDANDTDHEVDLSSHGPADLDADQLDCSSYYQTGSEGSATDDELRIEQNDPSLTSQTSSESLNDGARRSTKVSPHYASPVMMFPCVGKEYKNSQASDQIGAVGNVESNHGHPIATPHQSNSTRSQNELDETAIRPSVSQFMRTPRQKSPTFMRKIAKLATHSPGSCNGNSSGSDHENDEARWSRYQLFRKNKRRDRSSSLNDKPSDTSLRKSSVRKINSCHSLSYC
ncbi:MAG: hypothetical protein CMF52_07455 [Legionellales bacterium]|nr:hypothetical protein [Legionellales bacterium]